MNDLVSRKAVLELLQGSDVTGYKPSALREMVERLPGVPSPAVGSWVQPHPNTMARCSECGAASGGYEPEGKLFCSACGARMDGGVLSDPN